VAAPSASRMTPDPLHSPVLCLVGPTASGKSDVGLAVARRTRGEVIGCDAFAVYRGLALLSAAPTAPPDVPHHLVGVLEPHERCSAARFVADADRLVAEVRARGRTPLVVGGTALYLRSWLKGLGAPVPRDEALRRELVERARLEGPAALHAELLAKDPARAAQIHPRDERRLVRALEIIAATGAPASAARGQWDGPDRVAARVVGLRRTWEDLDARIERRTAALFEQGVLEEARAFLAAGPSPEARMALGLEDLAQVLAGRQDAATARAQIARLTRRFARRQTTFFRSFERVTWLDVAPDEPAESVAARALAPAT
jgi:tRNA dimethylallyltransferase